MTHKIEGGHAPRSVESVTNTPKTVARAGVDRSDALAASPAIDSLRLTGEAADLQTLARKLSDAPVDIDLARVNQIRASIDQGSYQVNPQAIANRMFTLERQLSL